MKNYLTILVTLFLANSVTAQWQWAKKIGGPQLDGGRAVLDLNTNVYCIGGFDGTCYFDNDTLYPWGANDMFLAKYDASGNELWVKGFGGNNPVNFNESITGRVIDNNNSCIYVSGQYHGSMTIDSYTISGTGSMDLFLAKFDFNGNCLWLKRAASSLEDLTGTVSIDPNGNVYWTGFFRYTAGFVDTTPAPVGWFLTKFDVNGNLVSVTPNFINGGSPKYLTVSNSEIVVSGSTGGYSLIIGTDTLTGSSFVDGFLFKMDLNLNVIWGKRFGGNTSSWDYPTTFDKDVNGNIYLVGGFEDTLTIDGTTITNTGKKDMFLAKFNSSGNLIWVRQANATGSLLTIAYMNKMDIDGLVYVTGTFNGSASFGSFNINASNTQDMFIARYDSNGDCVGVRHLGWAEGRSVDVDSNGDIVVAGIFINTINMGAISLTSNGGGDMFFAKSDAIVGIGDRESNPNNQLIIYANPTQGKCNITVPDDFLHEKFLTLSIFDNTGKLIQQKTLEMNEGKIKVNLEQEAKGVYNVTLSSKKKSYNGRVVFE